MGRPAAAGDSPVTERNETPVVFPSITGHVESGVNLGRPLSKAKYYWTTDSAIVARAKGEKNPDKGSEIEPETMYLRAVEGLWPLGATADGVPFA